MVAAAPAVDAHLAGLPAPWGPVLAELRARLWALLPEATETIAYAMPCLKVGGKGVAGFTANDAYAVFAPMSGTVTATLAETLAGYVTTKGTVRFTVEQPLRQEVLVALVEARLAELGLSR